MPGLKRTFPSGRAMGFFPVPEVLQGRGKSQKRAGNRLRSERSEAQRGSSGSHGIGSSSLLAVEGGLCEFGGEGFRVGEARLIDLERYHRKPLFS